MENEDAMINISVADKRQKVNWKFDTATATDSSLIGPPEVTEVRKGKLSIFSRVYRVPSRGGASCFRSLLGAKIQMLKHLKVN